MGGSALARPSSWARPLAALAPSPCGLRLARLPGNTRKARARPVPPVGPFAALLARSGRCAPCPLAAGPRSPVAAPCAAPPAPRRAAARLCSLACRRPARARCAAAPSPPSGVLCVRGSLVPLGGAAPPAAPCSPVWGARGGSSAPGGSRPAAPGSAGCFARPPSPGLRALRRALGVARCGALIYTAQ